MQNSSAARELLWEEQQQENLVQRRVERRDWLKRFAVAFGLIVLTLAVAMLLASLGADGDDSIVRGHS